MITVTINSVDRTRNVRWRSFRVENVLTNKVDSCSFEIFTESVENTYVPTIGQVVNVKDGATTVFEGPIVGVDRVPTNYKSEVYKIQCTDYTRFLDRRLVAETYERQSVNAIIANIISTYASDFTVNNVDCNFTADYVQFNYEHPSDALKQLADLTGYDWYVDENKDVHFFDKQNNPAPFSLTDTSGNWDNNSLIIRNDNSQIRNRIYVRGGEYLGTKFTAEIEATGLDTIYPLGYRYNEFAVTLTGQPLTVGIDNIDDEDNYDVMYNFQEKIIRFRDARKPSVGSDIRVSGKPYIPVIVRVDDQPAQDSIATAEGGTGIYEAVIIDKTIDTKQSARERATAEIDKFKDTIVEAQFTSKTAGLRAGQQITLNIPSRSVNTTYIINKVVYRAWTPTQFQYDVSLISTKTFGMLDWMQRQLRDERKKIEINPDEVLDVIEAFSETVTIGESISINAAVTNADQMGCADTYTAYIDSPPTWVAGPYNPSALEDRNRPPFTDRDCNLGS